VGRTRNLGVVAVQSQYTRKVVEAAADCEPAAVEEQT